jgi:hypothetical protein
MEPLEITYRYEPGYHWYASSRDLNLRYDEGMAAGGDTFEKAKAEVESVLRWSLEDESLQFTHCVHEDSIPRYLAERETAERAAAGKATAGAKR